MRREGNREERGKMMRGEREGQRIRKEKKLGDKEKDVKRR